MYIFGGINYEFEILSQAFSYVNVLFVVASYLIA